MKIKIKEIAVLGMIAAVMCITDLLMEALPNIHILAPLIVASTVIYRWKAVLAIYAYVFLIGFIQGIGVWWIPYLYVWTVLWAAVMLLPKNMPQKLKPIVYIAVASLHGFLFGTLYAPAQALLFGFDFKQTLMWIAAGIPFDIIHGVSNFVCSMLIIPIIEVLKRVNR